MRNTVCAKDVFVEAFDSFFLEEIDGALDPGLNWSSFLTLLRYYIGECTMRVRMFVYVWRLARFIGFYPRASFVEFFPSESILIVRKNA